MNKPNDGGPVYPTTRKEAVLPAEGSSPVILDVSHLGITIRQDFAGRAMQGMLACKDFMNDLCKTMESKEEVRAELARHAFAQADAMIAVQEKPAADLIAEGVKRDAAKEVAKEPGSKFKEGDPIKVSGDMDTAYRECNGIVKAVHRTGPTRWAYDTQLYACTDGFITQFDEDELEPAEDAGEKGKDEG